MRIYTRSAVPCGPCPSTEEHRDCCIPSARATSTLPCAQPVARRAAQLFALLLILTIGAVSSPAQVNVLTQHNDISRTGQNVNESLLTPANVNSSQFGLLFTLPVDGSVYTQPLYMSGLQIPGAGTHNVVFIATEHDSVYAFDADSNGGANASPLWKASLLTTAHGAAPGATTVSSLLICEDIVPEYGVTGTPVIDPVAGILYVVSFTQEGAAYVLRLHALSVTTGAEMLGGPVVIQAQVLGVGNGSSGGVLGFDPRWENQRPGLLLVNGVLYIGFASHADNGDWHGWILSYNATTLAQISAYSASPNGVGAGIWMSGDGLAADVADPVGHPFGRIFTVTGNGDYAANPPYTNLMDYGDSILNLDLTGGNLTVQDEFTPFNQARMNAGDGDLGSGGVLILPDQPGSIPHLLVQEGKAGTIYLINRDQMGGYNTSDNVVQEINSASFQNGIWGGPAYWNGNLYTGEGGNRLKARSFANGVLSISPTSTSPESFSYPSPTPAISALGNTNGILWAVETDAYNTGGISIVRAYDATNLGRELYTSNQAPARDNAGPANKFAVPTIANGKVYVTAGGQLDVYGLFSSEPLIAAPVITPGSTSFTSPVQVTITDATPGAVIYYTTDGSAPTTGSTRYTTPLTVNSTQTITAIAVAPGYVWIAPVMATYTSLNNTANPIFSPPGGIFTSSPSVTITDATPGAVIYYTLDGSQPTTSSAVYGAPIAVTGSVTIQAIAFAPGLSGSAVVGQTYTTQSGVNFSQGFGQAQSVMTFNGSTGLDDSRLQLTNGYTNTTGSAFVTAPLNIQAFTTDFLFQLSNPQADGITFTIQGLSPTAIGPNGSGLGYATIPKSVAVKFDFFNDGGEGNDSSGLYINGALPTIPAINLSQTGINLRSGDAMAVHMTYDGANLAMTVTDAVTAATWSSVWQVNIPQIVGGNTAYVGFTGSTQVYTASQKIATWTYTATSPAQPSSTATPVITPGAGTYASAQPVTLTDATSGAKIYYTTDGTAPTTASALYTAPFTISTSQTVQAMAVVPGGAVSGAASATLAITSGTTGAVPNYTLATGFNYGSMILNNGVTLVATPVQVNNKSLVRALQVIDGSQNEARSAYFANPLNVQLFTTDFDFLLANPVADGFTFVIQNQGLSAVGSPGGGLGYGLAPNGTGASIANSVALKFDIFSNSGEGTDSVGLYVNGASPTVPATDLTSSGLRLKSGDVLHAHILYDGTTLTLTLTDATASTSATVAYPINIPAAVGGNLAYVGFTGGTSASTAALSILDWTYGNFTVVTSPPVLTPNGGSFTTPTTISISDATPGAVIYYTTDGTAPTSASSLYTGPIPVNATGIVQAVALAPGDGVSTIASAGFTIQSPAINFPTGFDTLGLLLNGTTASNGILQLTDGGTNETRSAYFANLVNIQAFTTDFDFQLLKAVSDGFTFTIQNQGPTAVGSSGGGLGYGVSPTNTGPSINYSVAVKFDIHSNSGEGTDSTGVYVNGASPTLPSTNLASSGVQLNSGHVIHAHIVYDGANLTLTLSDATSTPATTVTETYPVNIPAVVGNSFAYVGFTGGTGGSTAIQNILDWTYSGAPPAVATATPVINPVGGTYTAPTSAVITDATPGALIYYTTNGTPPTAASTLYSGAVAVNATETIQAVAIAPGDTLSGVASAAFTIQIVTATPAIGPSPGPYSAPVTATISDATPGAAIFYTTDGSLPSAASNPYVGPIAINGSQMLQAIALATGASASPIASSVFTIQSPAVSYPSGFTSAGLVFNGGAMVNGTVLQLTDGGLNETRSAYYATPLNIQAFTSDFDFQELNALSDGFAFVIQNQGPNALGTGGGGLGYGVSPTGTGHSIANSIAIKFDIHNNSGEGADSTGIYLNGASPTLPSTNLSKSGIVLTSGHVIHAHVVYDGATLTLTLTDSTVSPAALFTVAYPVNIPATVGGNTAYVGFTAGTGGASAIQNILDWSFSSVAPSTSIPAFSQPAGAYIGAQTISITAPTAGSVVYYTTDGSIPNISSRTYSTPLTIAATTTLQAIAIAPGEPWSPVASAVFTIMPGAPAYSTGFQSPTLQLNGGATVNGTTLQLSDGGMNETRSAYFVNQLNIQTFTTDFDFQLLSAVSDGFTFVVQNQGPTATGTSGGGLGYGTSPTGAGVSIAKSVALKFDIHSNSGEGPDSTGIYLNGASPTLPATNLSTSGILLNSGHVIHAHVVYDGTNLTLTLTDATLSPAATVTVAYPVNIPSVVGGTTAYVGFTAGTGGSSAIQNILDWTFTNP